MRYRTLLGIAAALCVCAIAAGPAFAGKVFKAYAAHKEYTEAEPGKSYGHGKPGEMMDFKFPPFHIQCEKADAHSLVGHKQSKTYYTKVRFSKCTYEAKIGAQTVFYGTQFKTPVGFEYHANGFAETGTGSESEMKLEAPEQLEITAGSLKGCKILVPAQTIPVLAIKNPNGEFSAVSYENEEVEKRGPKGEILPGFPSGFQKQLLIENELTRITYSIEGGECEKFTQKGGNIGRYTGTLKEFILGGNLEIGEEEEVV